MSRGCWGFIALRGWRAKGSKGLGVELPNLWIPAQFARVILGRRLRAIDPPIGHGKPP